MQINPKAIFDSLSIAHKLDNSMDGFERDEIHLFAYFSAILYNYAGNPLEDWDYKFIIAENGYPHSKDLSDAISRSIINGHFAVGEIYVTITGRGTDEYYKFSRLFPTYENREKFIDAACSTSIIIPYMETKHALLNDPNIKKAKELKNEDWVTFDYQQLKDVTTALGAPVNDLVIPAVTWIEVLNTKIKENN